MDDLRGTIANTEVPLRCKRSEGEVEPPRQRIQWEWRYLSEDLSTLRSLHNGCDVVLEHQSMCYNARYFLYGLCNFLIAARLFAIQSQRRLKFDVQDVLVVAGQIWIVPTPGICCATGWPPPVHNLPIVKEHGLIWELCAECSASLWATMPLVLSVASAMSS